ncbi:MAG: hypothetical protein AAFY22_12675 [Pseudomonadota bacterium]
MQSQSLISRQAHFMKKPGAVALVFAAFAAVPAAEAFTTPAVGDLGYDLYNIVVNQGVLGPVGFMAAVIMLVVGVGGLIRGSIIPGIMSLIAAATVFAADQIVATLGFVV